MAFDIDGVLCDERPSREGWGPPGPPALYPARKAALPLVVTGRLEADRGATLAWFKRWVIRVERLKMFPGSGRERDAPLAISRFKAEVFGRLGRKERPGPL
jgi:hypothetical protein